MVVEKRRKREGGSSGLSDGLRAGGTAFVALLRDCAKTKDLYRGSRVHANFLKWGFLKKSSYVANAVASMYVNCGALARAMALLDALAVQNVFSWTAVISGFAQQGQGHDALLCFERMKFHGLSPDEVTFISILKACGSIGAADKGKEIHDEIAIQGLPGKNIVLGTALVDMYAKCGSLPKARQVLEELPARNVVSWTALMTGYAKEGRGEEALNCLEKMQSEGIAPNAKTLACILNACSSIGAADKGERIHDHIARQGLLGKDIVLGNALVDMYAKCGALGKARRVLEELPTRDVVSWNALIAGYAQQGQTDDVLNCFEQMQCKGFSPDAFTYSCVLSVCSHSGLVEEGQMYFANMSTRYGIKPNLEHYTCMVALFGRAGHLDKAVAIIKEMPSYDYPAVWRALLGACQRWRDLNIGRWAFERAVRVDKSDAAAYVLMANMYVAAGMHEDAENIQALRIKNEAYKKPARGDLWLDMNRNAHSLSVSNTRGPSFCKARKYC